MANIELASVHAPGNANLGIGVLNDRRIGQASRRLADMFGYESQELSGLDACSMCSLYAPRRLGRRETDQDLPDPGRCGSFSDEVQYRRKDGTRFWGLCGLERTNVGSAANAAIWVVEDITERRQKERTWRLGEERLQRALDASRIALWDYDLVSGDVYLSENWSALLGGPQLPTKTTFDALVELVPAEDRAAIMAAVIPAVKGDRPSYQVEHRVRKSDGELIWILSEGRVMERAANGRAVRAVGTNRDITERKRMEQALLASEAELRLITDSVPAIISYLDADLRYRFINRRFTETFGLQHKDVYGRHLREILGEADYQLVEERLAQALKGSAVTYERRKTRANGETGYFETRLIPHFAEDKAVVGCYALSLDVTERKRGEAQQRLAASVFDNAAVGIVITDKDSNILSVNRAFTEITGYAPEEVIGKNPGILRSEQQSRSLYDAMWTSLRQTGRWQGEIWNRRKDGQAFCELLSIVAIRDERGEVAQYYGIFADITRLKLTESEFMALNEELEQRVDQRTAALDHVNKELEAFSYSVSHDLRAPLRHISGFGATVLKENRDKLDAASVDCLQRIVAASERMGVLIADLLALSRVSQQEVNKREIDLSHLACQVAKSLIQAPPEREVRVRVQPEMKAYCDPGLIRIVLENLLGNAWKFTSRQNESRIEVGLEQLEGETVYYVRDNGAGFDMKYAGKLFQPFQRQHTDRQFAGTGIGLSIVHRIVLRHGGRIWAESEVGAGAVFRFTLA